MSLVFVTLDDDDVDGKEKYANDSPKIVTQSHHEFKVEIYKTEWKI